MRLLRSTDVPRTTLPWMDNTFPALDRCRHLRKTVCLRFGCEPCSISRLIGFTAGREDADPNIGYGNGIYGQSTYGLGATRSGHPRTGHDLELCFVGRGSGRLHTRRWQYLSVGCKHSRPDRYRSGTNR